MICANISPRMTCSVKFLEPTTMRLLGRTQPGSGRRSSVASATNINRRVRGSVQNLNHQGHEGSRRLTEKISLRDLSWPWWFMVYSVQCLPTISHAVNRVGVPVVLVRNRPAARAAPLERFRRELPGY